MAVHRTATGYQVQYYDADGRFRKRTYRGVTREEAIKIERELLAERDRGERPPDLRNAPMFMTFAATWKDERRAGWKASTLAQYEQILKSQLEPAFGDLRVSQVTESRVLQLMTRLQDTGLSARRINLVLLVVKSIVRAAMRRRFLRDDPLSDVKMLREPRTEVDPLGPEDVSSFLAACPIWWRPYFAVAFWTGARPNEMAALKWGDMDWASHRFRTGLVGTGASNPHPRPPAACATSTRCRRSRKHFAPKRHSKPPRGSRWGRAHRQKAKTTCSRGRKGAL